MSDNHTQPHDDRNNSDNGPAAASARKRAQLATFIDRKLAPYPQVQAVIAFGSVATNSARPGSDIDAYVFMDPVDLYVVPAESVWRQRDDTFHSIFSGDPSLEHEGLQLDLHRVDLGVWRDPHWVWPEHARAELADGWVAFDRRGAVAPLIDARTRYADDDRLRVIDEAVIFVAAQLPDHDEVPPTTWPSGVALDRCDGLQAGYDYLVRGLFAYNRRWLPWRNRQMRALLRLPWLPSSFEDYLFDAAVSPGHEYSAYLARARALRQLLDELVEQLATDGVYESDDPISEAFKRTHDEPGRAWNMTAWTTEHKQLS